MQLFICMLAEVAKSNILRLVMLELKVFRLDGISCYEISEDLESVRLW